MGRRACCDKIGLKKGPWSADEDKKLREFILSNGTKYCWRAVPKRAELLRCGKSCRLRWANYLRPDLKNDRLSKQEEKLVIDLHSQFGNKWSKIASHLTGRTDNYIKNYWHNHIKKQLCKMEIDSSITHKPFSPNKSQKKAKKSREKMHNQDKGRQEIDDETSLLEDSSIPNYHNHHLANEKLTIDAGFSIHEIPMIKPHEILIPPHSDLSSHYCSSSSNLSTPTASTTPSSSTINLIVEKLKSLPYWHGIINGYCRNNIGNNNIGYSNEDDFTEWNWLINELDIDKIDHQRIQSPPSS